MRTQRVVKLVILIFFSYLAAGLCYYVSFATLLRFTDWYDREGIYLYLLLYVPNWIVGGLLCTGILIDEAIKERTCNPYHFCGVRRRGYGDFVLWNIVAPPVFFIMMATLWFCWLPKFIIWKVITTG